MNRFLKGMLIIIALLLALNLTQGYLTFSLRQKAIAGSYGIFDPITHITCSSDGKYIYMVSGRKLLRSDDYGYRWIALTQPSVILQSR